MRRLALALFLLPLACGGSEEERITETTQAPDGGAGDAFLALELDASTVAPEVAERLTELADLVRASPEDPDRWLALGQTNFAQGRSLAARRCFERVLELRADDPRATYLRGHVLLEEGRREEAVRAFRRVDAISREAGGVGYAPAQMQAAKALVSLGDAAAARAAFQALVAEFPKFLEGRFAYGSFLLNEGDAGAALRELSSVDAASPDDRDVVAALARAHRMAGDAARSAELAARIAELEQTLANDDRLITEVVLMAADWPRVYDRGILALRTGNVSTAISCGEWLVEQRPEEASGYLVLGEAYSAAGRHGEAVDVFVKGLERDPELNELRRQAVPDALRADRAAEAEFLAKQFLARAEDGATRALLGQALTFQAKYAEAEAQFEALFAAGHPFGVSDWMMWGTAAIQGAKPESAVDYFRTATQLQPEFAPAHFNLGNALQLLARWDEALAAFARAAELDPRLPTADRVRTIERERAGG